MKTIYTVILSTSLFIIVSCNKDSSVNNNPGDGYWTLGTTQYNIVYTERSNMNGNFILSGIDSFPSADTIKVYFSSIPTVSEKYKVVAFDDGFQLNPDEIGIKIPIFRTGIYFSTGIADNFSWSPAQKADVLVTEEKIKIEIPKMTTKIVTPTYLDTVFLKATIIEE